jgi:purine-binding chemotaxis protein CheW
LELLNNTEDIIQLIGFQVGGKSLGADILSIREILRAPPIEAVENAPDMISGVIRLRGQTIPIVDLRERLGENAGRVDDAAPIWVLVVSIGEILIGMMVDYVTRIIRIDPGTILPAPEIIVSGMATPYIKGVCESEVGMLVVLNFDRLFTTDEIKEVKMMDVK